MVLESILKIVSIATGLFALLWGLFIFNKQQNFKRLQNLSLLWKECFQSEELLSLFHLMNELELNHHIRTALEDFPAQTKLKFLALIEEVALYTEKFEVDKKPAKYLFQWHFYFIYQSKKTSEKFWANLGGIDEMNASYWSKSKKLSSEFMPQ